MKIALIGYGKMGKLVEQIAQQRGHTIVAKTTSENPLSKGSLSDASICIDFSHPDCVVNNIKLLAKLGKKVVVGTTGWYDHLSEVKATVAAHNTALLYAPNFSIGVSIFLKIVAEAAALVDPFSQYDIAIAEAHHSQKADSPSGTAKAIAERIIEKVKRKKKIANTPAPDVVTMSSMRCGSIPGTHQVIIDSPVDTITLTHEARSRDGFAYGAVIAAEWLQDKTGFFTIEDMQ